MAISSFATGFVGRRHGLVHVERQLLINSNPKPRTLNPKQGSLDGGMAKSIFSDKAKFVQSLVKMYPQLKKSQDELEFGYKVKIPGLEEKLEAEGRKDECKITLLNEDMGKSLFEKMGFGGK